MTHAVTGPDFRFGRKRAALGPGSVGAPADAGRVVDHARKSQSRDPGTGQSDRLSRGRLDLAVSMAADAGQLQRNAMMSTIAHCLLDALCDLSAGIVTLTDRCLTGLETNPEACGKPLMNSTATATALVPETGYQAASELTRKALANGPSIQDETVRADDMSVEAFRELIANCFDNPVKMAS